MALTVLFFVLISCALYLFLCSTVRLPTISTTLASLRIAHPQKVQGTLIHVTIFRLSSFLTKFVRLSPERHEELAGKLNLIQCSQTPEFYISKIAANFILRLLLAVPVAFIMPIAAVCVAIWAIYQLWGDVSWLEKAVRARRARIEADLPRLASTLSQELQASRDVIGILSAYLPSCGPDFHGELKIALADMESGSPDEALTRMQVRVGSYMLYEIVQGLQAVLHGDDGVGYFRMLEHDFKQIELQNLRLAAKKRPGKVQFHSFIILGCFLFSVIAILLMFAWSKASGVM